MWLFELQSYLPLCELDLCLSYLICKMECYLKAASLSHVNEMSSSKLIPYKMLRPLPGPHKVLLSSGQFYCSQLLALWHSITGHLFYQSTWSFPSISHTLWGICLNNSPPPEVPPIISLNPQWVEQPMYQMSFPATLFQVGRNSLEDYLNQDWVSPLIPALQLWEFR